MKSEIASWFGHLQSSICNELEGVDKANTFFEEDWNRPGGGGGKTRVFKDGNIIEKGGVNFSEVFGKTSDFLKKHFNEDSDSFYATGISIVIHPVSPMVPIIHMNTRYFEMGKKTWFGGGIDLTPHYIKIEDARYFHKGLKKMCDKFDPLFYPQFKKQADDYFFITHRNETRGIGGIFYDYLDANEEFSLNDRFDFIKGTGELFSPLYIEMIERNKDIEYGENEISFQQLRRSRYAEFNLVYDRGTKFGLETNGRTESILMSLPPKASWEYNFQPEPGSPEAFTFSYLRKGIDWIGI